MDALSDSDDVFEKSEHNDLKRVRETMPAPKPLLRRGWSKEEPATPTSNKAARRPFTRARSAEPESNLSRQKSKSLPDLGLNSNTAGTFSYH